jgi:hypothetical protein
VTATVNIDLAIPVVKTFTLPPNHNSLTVPVTAFTAGDNVAVTGYMITATTTAPAPGAARWSATPPTAYTFQGAGTKTLCAWARDAAGNVSSCKSATTTIKVAQ